MNVSKEPTINAKEHLLSFLGLDKHYKLGRKDWLFYEKNGDLIKVLDLVGSYGINILGHNNPKIKATFKEIINSDQPAYIQGTKNPYAAELSAKIIHILNKETSFKERFCEFVSTGTEAVEIALKMCMLDYHTRIQEVNQQLNFTENFLQKTNHPDFKKVVKHNNNLDFRGCILHLEKSFHGKTLGSLSVIGNANLKSPFTTAVNALEIPEDPELFNTTLQNKQVEYWIFNKRTNRIQKKLFFPFIACILEPIRGEGGVLELKEASASAIKSAKQKYGFPVIADEIQTGLFRTQKMAALHHYNIEADIYCFAKGLGGGVAKIGAVSALSNRFDRHFFRYHSSSFGEDFYSCHIGCKVLDILQEQIDKEFPNLTCFNILKTRFPDLITEVRGKGLLYAFELNLDNVLISYLRKYLSNIGMAGYWLASVVLINEDIRILPSLSAPLTFRIEPSIYFSKDDLDFAINGLSNFLDALQRRDTNYLFDHMLPITKADIENEISLDLRRNYFPENAAVFLCHPVDTPHFQSFFDLTSNVNDEILEDLVQELAPLQEFYPYHVGKLKSNSEQEINVVYLGIPYTSNTFYSGLKNGKRSDIIARIQRAIDWANDRNAKVIGLGQFTSIITENGLRLKSKKAILSTGNAFTAQTTIDAMDKALVQKEFLAEESMIGIVGAAGNIMSVITKLLSHRVKHLSLVFNNSIWDVKKNVETIRDLLVYLSKAHPNKQLRKFLANELETESLELLLQKPPLNTFLSIHIGTDILSNCDVVLTGTNSTEAFINGSDLKANTIIVDLAVPGNVDVASLVNSQTYIKGGIIELPIIDGQPQALKSAIFPLEPGESYACMAETMGLALVDYKGCHLTGDIDVQSVAKVSELLKNEGFLIKRYKVTDNM